MKRRTNDGGVTPAQRARLLALVAAVPEDRPGDGPEFLRLLAFLGELPSVPPGVVGIIHFRAKMGDVAGALRMVENIASDREVR
ncbi:MAG: hypothetical protein HY689_09885 [Chloroflexi bacterium]|nr:hypothetical protein [Chloroflexota bacterium]